MSRLRSALHWVIAKTRLTHKVITNDDGDPYLLRVYLTPDAEWWRKRLPGVYLHRFYRSDEDREVHSHPWLWALSLILRGGYVEEYQQQLRYPSGRAMGKPWIEKRTFRPGSLNFITKDTFHRVELLDPVRGAWSLFVAGPRFRDWGFMARDGSKFETWYDRYARVKREKGRDGC